MNTIFKKAIYIICFLTIIYSCENDIAKEKAIDLLKPKIGNKLLFDDVKVVKIDNGLGVIVDKYWYYWIDENDKIYCVNGLASSVYTANNMECEYTYDISNSDINELVNKKYNINM